MAEPSCLRATRVFHDAVAVDYAERYRTGLEAKPTPGCRASPTGTRRSSRPTSWPANRGSRNAVAAAARTGAPSAGIGGRTA
ncbi:hypothetical protein ABT010_00140 [Streptomyces sp. NPDC002668]|uniref:hypothetical protein n=1 Tax=Streptomyces sp. NPDC002668 TaxID=3154422 RepID=UPI00331CA6A0